MQRVMILGGPGSGKSTLARRMGVRTGLPVHHMDHIHWLPGWAERPKPEKIAMAQRIERSPAWIFEGGLSATYDHRASRADTLVWLDLPVGLRMWRVTWRLMRNYGQRRPDMAEGCLETVHRETLPFYVYIWRTRRTHRSRIQRLIDAHPRLSVHQLTSRGAVARFIAGLGTAPVG
ncbi:AAA family ATPase [uncultured Roseobacter sp.]|uniref:AAA family ATPase n=1 Tax=uncultured Roseobacter sp. TaxID=114847 RepID=UPI002613B114|nr:AAA family ATPase [uncultured Roseobacter sp.]